MKKLKTLLLALAAGFLTVPDVQAQVMIGGVVAPEDLADGKDVVFEALWYILGGALSCALGLSKIKQSL